MRRGGGSLAGLLLYLGGVPSAGFDLRVSKAMYSKGYDALRVSVITEGPEQVSAPWSWDWDRPFVYRWMSKYLRSTLVSLGGTSKTLRLNDQDVELKIPAAGAGATGIFISDPCFSSAGGLHCPNAESFKMLERLTGVVNTLVGSEEFHFWGLLGDNFYDAHGEITSEFFSKLSTQAKAKPFMTVVGNHDLWISGGPPGQHWDEKGYSFMQFYGQDTVASTPESPYDFSGDPQREPAKAQNFIFATQVGDMAFFGYSGAHTWAETTPHAADFCRFVGSTPTVRHVVVLGHWNVANLGCKPGMEVPSVHARLSDMDGCRGKNSLYFMGHEHCNKVTSPATGPLDAYGFMLGGSGMYGDGCSEFGITVVQSIPDGPGGPNVRVDHFPLAKDMSFGHNPRALHDIGEPVLQCFQGSGYAGCREDHGRSWRATSAESIVGFTPPKPHPVEPVLPQTFRDTQTWSILMIAGIAALVAAAILGVVWILLWRSLPGGKAAGKPSKAGKDASPGGAARARSRGGRSPTAASADAAYMLLTPAPGPQRMPPAAEGGVGDWFNSAMATVGFPIAHTRFAQQQQQHSPTKCAVEAVDQRQAPASPPKTVPSSMLSMLNDLYVGGMPGNRVATTPAPQRLSPREGSPVRGPLTTILPNDRASRLF